MNTLKGPPMVTNVIFEDKKKNIVSYVTFFAQKCYISHNAISVEKFFSINFVSNSR